MSHFFKSIRIQNLLSFGPDSPELELKPINILIGPNGSGKSNLLTVFSFIQGLSYDTTDLRRMDEGSKTWFWNHNINETASYRITTARDGIHFAASYPPNELPSYAFLDAQTVTDLRKEYSFGHDFIFFFRDWQYGPEAPIRLGPQPIALGNRQLQRDGRNLAHVLKRITEDEQGNAKFTEFLSELYEDIEKVEVKEAEDYYFLYVHENGRKIPTSRISDGTLRYLALLAILCDPQPPKLICLEEPEMGLHPDLIQTIAKAIRYASERTQIIATTHSVSLVDDFTDTPESIVICEKIDGSTELRRLDPEEMAPWLEKYRLGDLWVSGDIGGNRW